jgi:hypothetical protein
VHEASLVNKVCQFNGVAPAQCKGKCFNPYVTMTVQQDAADELVWFDQRKITNLVDYGKQFHYDDRAGEGVTCYILDDGVDPDIPVSNWKLFLSFLPKESRPS